MSEKKNKLPIVQPEDVLDACDFVEEFLTELDAHPQRLAGTKDDIAASRLIRNRLHDETDAKTRLEAFKARPLAGRGSYPMLALWWVFCLLFYFVSFAGGTLTGILLTLLSLGLYIGGLVIFGSLYLGKHTFEKLLYTDVDYNVVSEHKRATNSKEKERTVIICDNHDALMGVYSGEFAFWKKLNLIAAPVTIFIFILFCILKMSLGTDTVGKITAFTILPFLDSLCGIFVILAHFSPFPKHARKNNGVATSVALATYAYFVENEDLIPDNVRIVYISFGAENAAHAGSRAFIAAHPEFADASVLCLSDIECGKFSVIGRDALRNLAASSRIINALNVAANAQDIPLITEEFQCKKDKFNCLHGFISNEFAQSNIPAATVTAKDCFAGEGTVAREAVEQLFSLSVSAVAVLMEDNS